MNVIDGLLDAAFEEKVSEERCEETDSEDERDADDGCEDDAAQQADAGTEGAGAERDAIFENDFVEKLGEEYPLRNFARAGGARGRHLLWGTHVGAENYGGVAVESGLGSLDLLHHADVFDHAGADAGEIKSAEKRIHVELAGAGEVD